MSSRLAWSFCVLRKMTTLFVGAWALTVSALNAAEGEYIGPIDVVVGPAQKVAYVVEYDAQRIDVLDVATNEVRRGIACPARPTGLAVKDDGSELYITCEGSPGVVCTLICWTFTPSHARWTLPFCRGLNNLY